MDAVIVYGSKYGTAKRYAETLGRMLDVAVVSYETFTPDIEAYTLIYIGGTYNDKILGLRKTLRIVDYEDVTELIIASVGLTGVENHQHILERRQMVGRQVPRILQNRMTQFYLPGAVDYQQLNRRDAIAMENLVAEQRPFADQNELSRQLVDSSGKALDLTDDKYLEPIVAWLKLYQ